MASFATILSLILAVCKLLGSLAQYASDTRTANETDAAALGRVLADAKKTIDDANAARAAAVARDATPDGLQQSDGFRRD